MIAIRFSMGKLPSYAVRRSWIAYVLWTSGVLLRWEKCCFQRVSPARAYISWLRNHLVASVVSTGQAVARCGGNSVSAGCSTSTSAERLELPLTFAARTPKATLVRPLAQIGV